MIEAEIRGKLGADSSRAHDRAEDLLTSTVFGLLRYLPSESGLMASLARARRVLLNGRKLIVSPLDAANESWLGLRAVDHFRIEFWPSLGHYRQPDLLIELLDAHDQPVHLVLIEAKLYSPKSGEAEEEEEFDADAPDPDQLVRYWQGLHAQPSIGQRVQRTLIYLTSHSVPPVEELQASLRRAEAFQPPMRLAWMHWRDIWQAVSDSHQGERGCQLAAADLCRLLAHKGFRCFNGFGSYRGTAQPYPPLRFWKGRRWFSQRAYAFDGKARFWRQ